MTTITKNDLVNNGYRMTVNGDDTIVSRSANAVKEAYLLHFVTAAQISAATATDTIGQCWLALTFLHLIQNQEFVTRTGGERKRNEYGDRITDYIHNLKSGCNLWLRKLEDENSKLSDISDICQIYFVTQIFKD